MAVLEVRAINKGVFWRALEWWPIGLSLVYLLVIIAFFDVSLVTERELKSHHYAALKRSVFFACWTGTVTAVLALAFYTSLFPLSKKTRRNALSFGMLPAFTHPVIACAAWKGLLSPLGTENELLLIYFIIPYFVLPFALIHFLWVDNRYVKNCLDLALLLGNATLRSRFLGFVAPLRAAFKRAFVTAYLIGGTIFFVPQYFGNSQAEGVMGVVYDEYLLTGAGKASAGRIALRGILLLLLSLVFIFCLIKLTEYISQRSGAREEETSDYALF